MCRLTCINVVRRLPLLTAISHAHVPRLCPRHDASAGEWSPVGITIPTGERRRPGHRAKGTLADLPSGHVRPSAVAPGEVDAATSYGPPVALAATTIDSGYSGAASYRAWSCAGR